MLGRVAILFGAASACTLLLKVLQEEELRIRATEQAQKGQMLLTLQAEQHKALAESIEETRKVRHDLKQHLTVVVSLAEQGELTELRGYVSRFVPQTQTPSILSFCENITVNDIVTDCDRRANEQNIRSDIQMEIPNRFPIQDTDLCIILGNLLDNAIEACTEMPQEQRTIRMRAKTFGDRFYLMVENSSMEAPRTKNGFYLSRKRGYHSTGTGLSSVEAVVHNYSGEFTTEATERNFRVSITMRGKTQPSF